MSAQISSAELSGVRAVSAAVRRDSGLDALRAAVTLLVVSHHTALTYGAIGSWYYREVPGDFRPGTRLLVLFCTVNQAWFMGLFFLLAGYFTPAAYDRKGPWLFMRDRLIRLGLPLLVYGVFIGPMTIALAQTARGRPFATTLSRLWSHGVFEDGPLWFASALLIFCVGYLMWRAIVPGRPSARPFPSNVTLFVAAVVTGLGAFALRLAWPVGTTVCNLQIGYFASYIVLFAAGCAAAPGRWLAEIPDSRRHPWLTIAWLTLPVLPAVALLAPTVPALRGDTSGGWNIQAVVYAFWEPFVAWGFILALVRSFDRRFRTLGSVWAALARRAFTIYIIHPPILVAVALAWRDVPAPHLVKFAVTGTLACLACFWIAGLLLRVRWVRQVI